MTDGQGWIQTVVERVASVLGQADRPVLLHAPTLPEGCWYNVKQCLDTNWVSSAGAFVEKFERQIAQYTGAGYAVATVTGTAALHVGLMLGGVKPGDEVLCPSLTFVATANAITYCGAVCHFVDVDPATLGIDPAGLRAYLQQATEQRDGRRVNRQTGRPITAVVPMHCFGHPVDMPGLMNVAQAFGLTVIEDAAESLGSTFNRRHTGTFGRVGVLSFNGNKIVTTGGGGMIITDDQQLADRARHLTTTAKQPHRWAFMHDQVGFNYRMPNINAAMGCAQLEMIEPMIRRKRDLAGRYNEALSDVRQVRLMVEPPEARSNYWLNTLLLAADQAGQRDALLTALNEAGFQCRPVWQPMHQLPMYRECPAMPLPITEDLAGRVVNLPSSAFLVDGESSAP
jgi:perosamine synthetase